MPVFLNNCDARPHARFYPADGDAVAFFDLDRGQSAKLGKLERGSKCVVATPDGVRHIRFDWYTFTHDEKRPAPEGVDVRVLFGNQMRSETLTSQEAIAKEPYSVFFEKDGGFRRGAVIART